MEFFKSAVASAIAKGSSFPYSTGDRVDIGGSIWTLNNATKRDDGSPCSIFSFDIASNRSAIPLAKNAVRKFRTLRHPGVIKVLDTIETDTTIYIITERVTPLSWAVKRKSVSEETAKWGLHAVASTLKFINEEAKSVHGCVRVNSVFIGESGEWKLGGFDILSSMNEDDAVIYTYGSLVPDFGRYAPPEVAKSGWDAIKRNPVPAPDAYDFGVMIYEIFNGSFQSGDSVVNAKVVPPSMQQSYKRLVNANPKLRLSIGGFLEQGTRSEGFFETPLIRLTQDIDNLGLKSDDEREEFLSQLDELSDDFPEEFFKMKVLPELMKSVEFGGGGPKVLTAIMKIGTKLSDEEFAAKINPLVVRLFSSLDRAMRVCLLDSLPMMIDRLPQKLVNDKIFPQLVTGFSDTAPVVREQTVKSVLVIIGKLSDRVINGDLLRHLAKTANDEQPGIRTNTTICLGKIARNLGGSTRSKVLVAAFSRSLKDPFVHARNAALLALAATADVFSDDDCATKILPAICPSLVDKEKMVRDSANKTLDMYLSRVRNYSQTLPDTVLPPPTAGTANNGAPARVGTPSDNSWAGWAISSFTNKATTAQGELGTSTNGATSATKASEQRSSSVPAQPVKAFSPATTSLSSFSKPALAKSPLSSGVQSPILDASENEDEDAFDAWGEMEDMKDDFDTPSETASKDEGPASIDAIIEPDVPSTPEATSPKPVAKKVVKKVIPTVKHDDGGEPDFAGWLAAQSAAKTKKPLAKGLGVSSASRPSAAARTTTTGSIGAGAGAKKLASTTIKPKPTVVKKVEAKPKPKEEASNDDDWGDAW